MSFRSEVKGLSAPQLTESDVFWHICHIYSLFPSLETAKHSLTTRISADIVQCLEYFHSLSFYAEQNTLLFHVNWAQYSFTPYSYKKHWNSSGTFLNDGCGKLRTCSVQASFSLSFITPLNMNWLMLIRLFSDTSHNPSPLETFMFVSSAE